MGRGQYDYYSEELGTNDPVVAERCINYLTKKKVNGHWKCYCGSGKKLRYCHQGKMWELRGRIPPKTAKLTRQRLLESRKKIQTEQKRQKIEIRTKLELMLNPFHELAPFIKHRAKCSIVAHGGEMTKR